ncbi:LysR family transcriptional regulator [Rhizobium sp. NPDC090279]|uniref:LysR family transcriptional regulator n=1 Tax=Rhizobium sp. NPDC090279 TaxID=3364499 RepID=UPI00383A345A
MRDDIATSASLWDANRMNIATLAMTLAVMQEGSVRGAARLLRRPVSTVAAAFERFEAALVLKLALRIDGVLSFTLAGETFGRSMATFVEKLGAIAEIAEPKVTVGGNEVLIWAAGSTISIGSLSHFNHVVRAGSVRRAARLLGIGQPNLSRQMLHLETVLGCPLLVRASEGCMPTAQGAALNEAGLALVAQVAELTAPAKMRFAQESRTVKLGTIIPISHEGRLAARLARLVAQWREDDARPDLLVSSTTAEDLLEGLKSGRFDVVLLDIATRHKQFESLEIFAAELVLVAPSEVMAAAVPLESMIADNLMAVPSMRSGLRQQISEALGSLMDNSGNGDVSSLVEVDALSIIIRLVSDHGYLSILPMDTVPSSVREISIARLPGNPQVWFHLVWRRTQAARRIAMQLADSLARSA